METEMEMDMDMEMENETEKDTEKLPKNEERARETPVFRKTL